MQHTDIREFVKNRYIDRSKSLFEKLMPDSYSGPKTGPERYATHRYQKKSISTIAKVSSLGHFLSNELSLIKIRRVVVPIRVRTQTDGNSAISYPSTHPLISVRSRNPLRSFLRSDKHRIPQEVQTNSKAVCADRTTKIACLCRGHIIYIQFRTVGAIWWLNKRSPDKGRDKRGRETAPNGRQTAPTAPQFSPPLQLTGGLSLH